MAEHTCAVCRRPIDICPNGGDCGEMQLIYREQQREKLRDIDLNEIDCYWCDRPVEECCFDPCAARKAGLLS